MASVSVDGTEASSFNFVPLGASKIQTHLVHIAWLQPSFSQYEPQRFQNFSNITIHSDNSLSKNSQNNRSVSIDYKMSDTQNEDNSVFMS